jgi:tetratricopeptide (TPR) repeat protein
MYIRHFKPEAIMSKARLGMIAVIMMTAGAAAQQEPDWWKAQQDVTAVLMAGQSIVDLCGRAARNQPKSAQEAMFNVSVLMRAGMTREAVAALKRLRELAPKLDAHQVTSIYFEAFDKLEQPQVAQAAAEIFADNFSGAEIEYRLQKYFEKSGWTVDQIDAWLKQRSPGRDNFWLKERLRYNLANGRGAQLIRELEDRVRKDPQNAAEAMAFLDALIHARPKPEQKPDLAWMPETLKLHLASEMEGIAARLRSLQEFTLALAFYQKALEIPITDNEAQRMAVNYQAIMAAERIRIGFTINVLEDMAQCLLKLNRNDEAQKRMVEAADIRKEHNVSGNMLLAGQVQQASGARVIEGRVKEEEKKSEDDPAYWSERAEYYRGRKDASQEEEALKKGLSLTTPRLEPDQPMKNRPYMRSWLLGEYALFLKRQKRTEEAVNLLEEEILHAPADSLSALRAASLMATEFPERLRVGDEAFWSWLANRAKWEYTEEPVLWRMLEKAPNTELDKHFARAEAMAMDKDPSRAHTLGWIMNRMHHAQRSIPLLQYAIQKAPDAEFRKRATFTLLESYLDTGNWRGAEQVFPEACQHLTAAEAPEWWARIAVIAANAGAREDALRIWKSVANLNLTATNGLSQLANAGLKDELVAFYRDMQKRLPTSEAPAKALKVLGQI